MSALLLAVFGLALLGAFFALLLLLDRPSKESALLAEAAETVYQPSAASSGSAPISVERLAKPFARIRRLFGGETDPEISRRLLRAGYRKPYHADIFVGAKLLAPVAAGLLVAFALKQSVVFWFVFAIAVGFFLPDFWLVRAIHNRRNEIRLALPDALDLLAICVEAGLGLDQAILKVATELKISHPALGEELLQITLEQRAGGPRIAAWRNMADRVGLDSVRSFVNMLVQTERFGTPISKSLAVFSDALRTQRRQLAEENAAKTTIKLVLPLVFFIMPSIFVVTIAPAVLTIMKSFGTVL
ncbi:MAG TPA: type II secretion system F family protein [Verrucomicrobiae bacterium]|nr:type II secretion system F family protein [Verrucomicrobiae bacterium]